MLFSCDIFYATWEMGMACWSILILQLSFCAYTYTHTAWVYDGTGTARVIFPQLLIGAWARDYAAKPSLLLTAADPITAAAVRWLPQVEPISKDEFSSQHFLVANWTTLYAEEMETIFKAWRFATVHHFSRQWSNFVGIDVNISAKGWDLMPITWNCQIILIYFLLI